MGEYCNGKTHYGSDCSYDSWSYPCPGPGKCPQSRGVVGFPHEEKDSPTDAFLPQHDLMRECPECGEERYMSIDDYICANCRASSSD